MLNPIYAHMVKYVLHKASKILAVSEFNKHEIEKNTGITDVDIVYNCIGHDKFVPKGKKENIVVTVGFVKKETWTRKGIYDFVKAAETFVDEDVRFVVAGRISKDIEKEVSKIKNVSFTGFLSDKKLLELYQKAKVVCQLSRYESFGIAPAEGMLCECVPVVTSDGALPEVVGNCGMYTCYVTSEIRRAIKSALSSDMGKQARQRIVETYPLERREKELVEILEAC